MVTTGRLIQAARIIKNGGVVAYATEYCFGFGCDPMNRSAVLRLLRIKRRTSDKGLILIAADVDQLDSYVDNIPAPVLATWPGPHTWLLAPRAGVPGWIMGKHPRIAVRVTAHPQAAALCRAAGMAIISTSANHSSGAPTRSYRETLRRFKGEVDYVLPGMVGDASAPTPIRDAASGELIRLG
ncbi:L-threonylcarbamoyladenylate synthase [Sulfuricaulis sp.]|uniref:L-threonylcarbamoyladenylate synthase n=1 Tax=Sulfuricaulis sp. TaxID=2003553 RepID=UPI00355A3786